MQTDKKVESIIIPIKTKIPLIIIAYIFAGGLFQLLGAIIAKAPYNDLSKLNTILISQKIIIEAFNFLSILIIVYLFRILIDKKSFVSIGLQSKNNLLNVINGFIIALTIIGSGSLFLLFFGDIKIIRNVGFSSSTLLYSTLLYLLVSLGEEFLFRGYILNNLLQYSNKYIALVLSAVIFACFHIFNPNLNGFGFLNIFLTGILFGLGYILKKNLWLPISMHFFWNFIQGPILGYNVSGLPIKSYSIIIYNSKNIINGGDFGFEGSLVCLIILAICILGFLFSKKIVSNNYIL